MFNKYVLGIKKPKLIEPQIIRDAFTTKSFYFGKQI